jgi:transcription elongation factor Elf1
MSAAIDRKFLGYVSHKLQLFKQKNTDLYNFRCPFCNDSQKNKAKARGYVYRKANDYFYRCHNCGKSTTFSKFLQEVDSDSHRAYVFERYSKGETGNHNYQKPTFDDLRGNAFARFESTVEQKPLAKTWHQLSIQCIDKLPEGHFARSYIENRRIPKEFWKEIFFTPTFKDFLDTEFPDHGKEEIPNDERIVLAYTNENGEVTNIAGRALTDTKIRYVTVKILDEKKLYGMHRLRKQEKVYVVEGQFDSLFLPNCIASGDSSLGNVAAVLEQDCILVYDNEPRNKDIVKQIEKSIDASNTVCLFPEDTPGKDINEMIINGFTCDQIKNIIDSNTFSGLSAKLRFAKWKRC